MVTRRWLLGALSTLQMNCTSVIPYYWGEYEDLLFRMYDSPGEAAPDEQIEEITADIQRARGAGLLVPPGIYAHRASMYLKVGNDAAAAADLEREKALFSEAAVMVNRMLERM